MTRVATKFVSITRPSTWFLTNATGPVAKPNDPLLVRRLTCTSWAANFRKRRFRCLRVLDQDLIGVDRPERRNLTLPDLRKYVFILTDEDTESKSSPKQMAGPLNGQGGPPSPALSVRWFFSSDLVFSSEAREIGVNPEYVDRVGSAP